MESPKNIVIMYGGPRSIASLLWSGVFSAFPNVRFVFSHGGGVLPMVAERVIAMGFVDRSLAAKVPEGAQAALSRLYVDTASVTSPPAMAALTKWLPEGQILYGTDFPWGTLAASRASLARLGLPVIMVVGIRLGCINHALLTQQAILAKPLRLAGWVANRIDPDEPYAQAMVDSLRQRIRAPLLGQLPWSPAMDARQAARLLDPVPLGLAAHAGTIQGAFCSH